MDSTLYAIAFGLASAFCWGTGDFCGGLATRRANVYGVVIGSQFLGMLLLIVLGWLLREPIPGASALLIGSLAGIMGGVGVMALYQGLASGRMGIIAPVAAVITALVPVIFGLIVEGLPTHQQLAGFAFALIAVWLITRAEGETQVRVRDLGLPVIAGLGFGLFFILIDQVSDDAILWPLVTARLASLTALFAVALLLRQHPLTKRQQVPLIALTGIFDVGGNAMYALATRMGRLDIAAILSSLYPGVVVILAGIVLKEKLAHRQWAGVVAALVAVVLIAA